MSALGISASRSLASALWKARSLAACSSTQQGVNSSCRRGVDSGCRLTVLDPQMRQRPTNPGQPALVHRTIRLRRDEVVAAAIRIEARRQAVRGEHL
jgi:hypothetical protein